jgi:hypothetical protein
VNSYKNLHVNVSLLVGRGSEIRRALFDGENDLNYNHGQNEFGWGRKKVSTVISQKIKSLLNPLPESFNVKNI